MSGCTVAVVGPALLEVIARTADGRQLHDEAGSVGIEVGGRGGRIVASITEIGVNARFLTALNTSLYATLIEKQLTECGADVRVHRDPALPAAIATELRTESGQMIAYVAANSLATVRFGKTALEALVDGASAIVVDAGVSDQSMADAINAAADRQIPVFVTGVTTLNMDRIAPHLQNIRAIFIGQGDSAVVGDLGWDRQERRISLNGATSVRRHPDALIVMHGGDVVSVSNGQTHYFPVTTAMREAMRGSEAEWHRRFGSALVAHYVYQHIVRDAPHVEAVPRAMEASGMDAAPAVLSARGGRRETIETLMHSIANLDRMTSVLNRGGTETLLAQMTHRFHAGELDSLSLVMVDIDHFKQVNDSFGHDEGDRVIVAVVNAIRGLLRGSDTVGRWGGEEFLVLLPNAPDSVASRVAERIRATVEQLFGQKALNLPRQITVSLGVAAMEQGESSDATVKRADLALYSAKESGRNRVALADAGALAHAPAG